MPQIEIRDNGHDGIWIMALMHFPNDEQLRRSYYAVQHAKLELETNPSGNTIEIETGLLNALIDAPSHAELKNLVVRTAKHAIVAGDLLASIFTMHSFPELCEEPSIKKAIFVAEEFAKTSAFGDGTPLPSGKTAIRKYVKEFRSVAHLWAARRLHQVFPPRAHKEMLASPAAIREFLGIAALLQDFGCWFAASRPRDAACFLEHSTMWRVPNEIPRLFPPWTGPSPWFIETLGRYKAEIAT